MAAARFYLEKREEILAVGGLPLEGLSSNKRKADGDEPTDVDTPLNKRAKSDTAAAPAFKMPTFGTGAPANFMAQFGQSAAEAERKEKEKRKAEDFDSDEDDEEEWERRYAEERRAKKQKLAQAAKGKTAVFVPGKGFVLADGGESGGAAVEEKAGADAAKAAASTGGGLFGSGASTPSTAGGASVFDSPDLAAQQKTLSNNNIFGHLSDADSGVDGSKTGDADDEDTSSEGDDAENDTVDDASKPPAQAPPTADAPDKRAESSEPDDLQSILRKSRAVQSASKEKTETGKSTLQSSTSGRSLFDRISKDDNGNKSTALNPSSTAFGYSVKPADDHTWKQDNPIKFGASGTAPSFVLTSATPTKSTPVEDKSTPPSPFTGLFGGPKPSVESPTKLPSNTSGTPTKTADVGFGFGGPPKSVASTFLIPSAPASATTSRATSPGMTTDTGGESANESTAEGAEAEKTVDAQQLNLLTGGPGEEDEDVVFEVRAKAMMWVSNTKDDVTKAGWVNKGLGPLRVLKDRQSGKCRIIVRLDPSGRLILNAALLAGVGYQHQSPSVVKLAAASEDGKLNTWIVKVRKDDDAIKLARILEENKPRN